MRSQPRTPLTRKVPGRPGMPGPQGMPSTLRFTTLPRPLRRRSQTEPKAERQRCSPDALLMRARPPTPGNAASRYPSVQIGVAGRICRAAPTAPSTDHWHATSARLTSTGPVPNSAWSSSGLVSSGLVVQPVQPAPAVRRRRVAASGGDVSVPATRLVVLVGWRVPGAGIVIGAAPRLVSGLVAAGVVPAAWSRESYPPPRGAGGS